MFDRYNRPPRNSVETAVHVGWFIAILALILPAIFGSVGASTNNQKLQAEMAEAKQHSLDFGRLVTLVALGFLSFLILVVAIRFGFLIWLVSMISHH